MNALTSFDQFSTLPDCIPERIRSRIQVDPLTGCWLWTGSTSGTGRGGGYGRVSYLGRTVAVHLLIWRLTGQRILRPGQQLDHECVVRACCFPGHGKPRSGSMNMRLAYKRRRRRARA